MLRTGLKPAVLSGLLFGVLLVANVPAAYSAPGGTLRFTGTHTFINPCNSEQVTGPLDTFLVVRVEQNDDGQTEVNVRVTFQGTVRGSLNEYDVHAVATGEFKQIS